MRVTRWPLIVSRSVSDVPSRPVGATLKNGWSCFILYLWQRDWPYPHNLMPDPIVEGVIRRP
jgi:hypothetical protein